MMHMLISRTFIRPNIMQASESYALKHSTILIYQNNVI